MSPVEGHNAIWLQRSRNALMASQQARGRKALWRWQRDKWFQDGCKDCGQDKEKETSHGRRGQKEKRR